MPVLSNARHERFAQLLAQGLTATDAHEQAGYKRHDGNASQLAKHPDIMGRLAEISGKVAAAVADELAITAKSLIQEAEEIKKLAIIEKQYAVALNAIREKGILSGQRIEKSEHGLPGEFEAIADAELEAQVDAEARELGIAVSGTQH